MTTSDNPYQAPQAQLPKRKLSHYIPNEKIPPRMITGIGLAGGVIVGLIGSNADAIVQFVVFLAGSVAQ
jgi:hypothetical protein